MSGLARHSRSGSTRAMARPRRVVSCVVCVWFMGPTARSPTTWRPCPCTLLCLRRTQHDTTRHDTTRHDTTRHDTTRHDTTRHDTTRHDTTRHDTSAARFIISGAHTVSARSWTSCIPLSNKHDVPVRCLRTPGIVRACVRAVVCACSQTIAVVGCRERCAESLDVLVPPDPNHPSRTQVLLSHTTHTRHTRHFFPHKQTNQLPNNPVYLWLLFGLLISHRR
jgi:hypothetical protein